MNHYYQQQQIYAHYQQQQIQANHQQQQQHQQLSPSGKIFYFENRQIIG